MKRKRKQRPRRRRYDVEPLRRARELQGLTNTLIGKAVRRDQSIVARTLSGDPQYQGAETVKAIADFLRVPMEHLLPANSQSEIRNPQSMGAVA